MTAEPRTCRTCGCAPCINPGFCRSCRDADKKARQEPDLETALRRKFIDKETPIDLAWRKLNLRAGLPLPSVEALIWSLRARGLDALKEPGNRRRLATLTEEQAIHVGDRLQSPIA